MPKVRARPTPKASEYWQHLIEGFSSQAKLWLEGFEINTNGLPAKKNYSTEKITLPSAVITALKKFSQQKKLPIATIIHGAWGLLLNRYSTSDDIIFGAASFSENKKTKVIETSGPLVPVRSIVHEEETILNYLKSINTELQQNLKHIKNYDKEAKDNTAFNDLFSYLLLFQSSHSKTNGKNNKETHAQLDPDVYPLVFTVHHNAKILLEILYNENKFTHDNIKRLANHFIVVLQKVLHEPDQFFTHYSILTEQEQKDLLNNWNKPLQNKNGVPQLECVHDIFVQQAKRFPNHPAVVHNNTTVTYQQLDAISNQIAQLLLQRKVHAGDTVAVLMERTPAILATMLAIFKIGAVYVPLNPKYPDERIKFILDDCKTHLILVTNTQRIPEELLYKTIVIDDTYHTIKSLPAQLPANKLSPEHIAYVIYTSGTTGQPKGVMIKHASLVNLVGWYKNYFFVTPDDRASQFASQGFDTFFCETIPFLLLGASIHIVDDGIKLTPAAFLPWLAENKITICDLPTAYGQILFNLKWPDNLSLRLLKVGGENFTQYPTQKFSFDIWNGYGPTEATVEASFIKLCQANIEPENQPYRHFPPPIGKPIVNIEMYVVDQHMEPVPIGSVGELLIGGAGLSPGYLNRPELTQEKFIWNIFSTDPNAKLYRTGDLVRWLSDGNIEFVGRIDHQVKIRGYRIELSEIETAINQHPDVNEVVVIAKELISGQKSLLAYLVPNLERIRIPFQERCLVALDELQYLQVITEDISREGMAITGLTEKIDADKIIRFNVKLPGMSGNQWLTGKVRWQQDQRAGVHFEQTTQQKNLLHKSIEYYLSTHNLMETLQSAAAKRSLRKALKKKLPDYMIPTVFSILPSLPLTINGKVDWKALPPPKDFERLTDRNYTAPRNETEKLVAEIWCEVLNQNQVSITDSFFDLGGNSLLVSQLSIKMLQKFDISIPAKILFDLPFIPIIAEYIDSKGAQYTYTSSIQDEISHDAILRDDLVPNKVLSKHIKKPQNILLTGAAGFLGIYLLRELLKKTDAKIYCLIRKGEFENVAKRLINNINHYKLNDEISLNNRRIIIIASDIGLDQFGIPIEQYENLAEKIDLIYHCGAQVNTMSAYSNLRTSNVQGTLEVIKFALRKVDKPIHYISTLSAAYKTNDNGKFTEEFPNDNSSNLTGGYALSKWVSERLLTQAKNRGLPVAIYRSGYILGQSDNGITNINDALLLLIKGCIQLGAAPNWKEKIMILPVDFVSAAIVDISLNQGEKSNVFHLDHPAGMLWTDLIAWLNNYGYSIALISHQEWLQKLAQIGRDNALYPFLPHYLSQTQKIDTTETDMSNTMSVLKEINLAYPKLDDVLLQSYMDYLCQEGFFPAPHGKRKRK